MRPEHIFEMNWAESADLAVLHYQENQCDTTATPAVVANLQTLLNVSSVDVTPVVVAPRRASRLSTGLLLKPEPDPAPGSRGAPRPHGRGVLAERGRHLTHLIRWANLAAHAGPVVRRGRAGPPRTPG